MHSEKEKRCYSVTDLLLPLAFSTNFCITFVFTGLSIQLHGFRINFPEEKRTLERELARVKVSASRIIIEGKLLFSM